jgi:stage III sporulation protein SpoIIIAA
LHKISTITNLAGEIIGITIRFVPTTSPLSPELISDLLACFGDSRQVGFSTLFIGPASVSLPSVLRSMAAVISSGGPAANATRRTLVIDTSGEIGGASDVAVASLGSARRILVPEGTQQAEVLSSALQNQVADVAVVRYRSHGASIYSYHRLGADWKHK